MGDNYMYGKNLSKYLEALYQKDVIERKLNDKKNQSLEILIEKFKDSSGISENLMKTIDLKKTEKGISVLIENKEIPFEIKSNIDEIFNKKGNKKAFDYNKYSIDKYTEINQNRSEVLDEIKFFFMKKSVEIECDIQELIEEYLEEKYKPKTNNQPINYMLTM